MREAGATLEDRVKKGDGKGTAFADLVWKPVVLIEMKKRGEDLTRHYRQAFDYWTRLVPGRPRYVMLCNFDEFWVYDFDTQMDAPVDQGQGRRTADALGSAGISVPEPLKPIFGNDQVAVTRKAADQLADCFNKLIDRKVDRRPRPSGSSCKCWSPCSPKTSALLDNTSSTDCWTTARRCRTVDLLGGLFEAMNTPAERPAGDSRASTISTAACSPNRPGWNSDLDEVASPQSSLQGRLVESPARNLRHACSSIRLEKTERHAFGAHFTHPTDIMKIVGPTIVEPWRKLIEEARHAASVWTRLWQRMHAFHGARPGLRVGQLPVHRLSRVEAAGGPPLRADLRDVRARPTPLNGSSASLRPASFYGMDINPFAVELAKVTMMIARKLAIDELHITETALPLDNLDANFMAADALIDASAIRARGRRLTSSSAIRRSRAPSVSSRNAAPTTSTRSAGPTPTCRAWPIIASTGSGRPTTTLPPARRKTRLPAGRVGRHPEHPQQPIPRRRSGPCATAGTIVEAVDNQPWSGEANVHVSIANWVKTQIADCYRKRDGSGSRSNRFPSRITSGAARPDLPRKSTT